MWPCPSACAYGGGKWHAPPAQTAAGSSVSATWAQCSASQRWRIAEGQRWNLPIWTSSAAVPLRPDSSAVISSQRRCSCKPHACFESLRNAPGVLVVPRVRRETIAETLSPTDAGMGCCLTAVPRTAERQSLPGHGHLLDVPGPAALPVGAMWAQATSHGRTIFYFLLDPLPTARATVPMSSRAIPTRICARATCGNRLVRVSPSPLLYGPLWVKHSRSITTHRFGFDGHQDGRAAIRRSISSLLQMSVGFGCSVLTALLRSPLTAWAAVLASCGDNGVASQSVPALRPAACAWSKGSCWTCCTSFGSNCMSRVFPPRGSAMP